ncbi:hypothetical protein T265_10101 [Opisthorchis viverrini]|uniref:Uncharacterized protein n=1 Tax=Opisthorchis viverrini TaxID=6198 RepID=A0A074Z3I1_OPIVI|nr:hypothetical protein T265_10101 [Opisthorchis viverrini]KER21606.1 hypothetical protein T265_10101 [Opisthorchis viverrini]
MDSNLLKKTFFVTCLRVLELDYAEELTAQTLDEKLAIYSRRHSFLSPVLVVKLTFEPNLVSMDRLTWWPKEDQHHLPYSHVHNVLVFNNDPKRVAIDIIHPSTAKRRVFLFKTTSMDDCKRILCHFQQHIETSKLYDYGNVRFLGSPNWRPSYRTADKSTVAGRMRKASLETEEKADSNGAKRDLLKRQPRCSLPRTEILSVAEKLVDDVLRNSHQQIEQECSIPTANVRRKSTDSCVQASDSTSKSFIQSPSKIAVPSSLPVRLILPLSARVSVCEEEYGEFPRSPLFHSSYFQDRDALKRLNSKRQFTIDLPEVSFDELGGSLEHQTNTYSIRPATPQPRLEEKSKDSTTNEDADLPFHLPVQEHDELPTGRFPGDTNVRQGASQSDWTTSVSCISPRKSALGVIDQQGSRYVYMARRPMK